MTPDSSFAPRADAPFVLVLHLETWRSEFAHAIATLRSDGWRVRWLSTSDPLPCTDSAAAQVLEAAECLLVLYHSATDFDRRLAALPQWVRLKTVVVAFGLVAADAPARWRLLVRRVLTRDSQALDVFLDDVARALPPAARYSGALTRRTPESQPTASHAHSGAAPLSVRRNWEHKRRLSMSLLQWFIHRSAVLLPQTLNDSPVSTTADGPALVATAVSVIELEITRHWFAAIEVVRNATAGVAMPRPAVVAYAGDFGRMTAEPRQVEAHPLIAWRERVSDRITAHEQTSLVVSSHERRIARAHTRDSSAPLVRHAQPLPGNRRSELHDAVHFTMTGPVTVARGVPFILSIWAHLATQRNEVLTAVATGLQKQSQGPARVRRGTRLSIRLDVEGFRVATPKAEIWWVGEIACATFRVDVPASVRQGPHAGTATVSASGLRIMRLEFTFSVASHEGVIDEMRSHQSWSRSAFVSYARRDYWRVRPRLQGMRIANPQIELFVDRFWLRSGQRWRLEILRAIDHSDVFYLFWSRAAKRSRLVRWEWQRARKKRGLAFIHPVPLDPPEVAKPPKELESLHFDDPFLH